MTLLYHIVPATDWAQFSSEPNYEAASLQTEGFIHLSTKGQVAGVLDRFYRNAPDLLLLHVDANRLTHTLRYDAADSDYFPHLYGPLNKDAVVTVERIDKLPYE